MIHVSTVPKQQVPFFVAFLTISTLSINQRSFTALKYGDNGKPHKGCKRLRK